MKVVKHQHRLLREAVGVLILGDIQNLIGHCPEQPAVTGLA